MCLTITKEKNLYLFIDQLLFIFNLQEKKRASIWKRDVFRGKQKKDVDKFVITFQLKEFLQENRKVYNLTADTDRVCIKIKKKNNFYFKNLNDFKTSRKISVTYVLKMVPNGVNSESAPYDIIL